MWFLRQVVEVIKAGACSRYAGGKVLFNRTAVQAKQRCLSRSATCSVVLLERVCSELRVVGGGTLIVGGLARCVDDQKVGDQFRIIRFRKPKPMVYSFKLFDFFWRGAGRSFVCFENNRG